MAPCRQQGLLEGSRLLVNLTKRIIGIEITKGFHVVHPCVVGWSIFRELRAETIDTPPGFDEVVYFVCVGNNPGVVLRFKGHPTYWTLKAPNHFATKYL